MPDAYAQRFAAAVDEAIKEALDQAEAFLKEPLKWSAANGGISELPRAES